MAVSSADSPRFTPTCPRPGIGCSALAVQEESREARTGGCTGSRRRPGSSERSGARVDHANLAGLSDGKSAQVYNRSLTVTREDGRAVARLDARAGDGGALFEGIQLGDGIIEVDLKGKDVAQQSFLGHRLPRRRLDGAGRGVLPALQLQGRERGAAGRTPSSTCRTRRTPGSACEPSGRDNSSRRSSPSRTRTAGSMRASSSRAAASRCSSTERRSPASQSRIWARRRAAAWRCGSATDPMARSRT